MVRACTDLTDLNAQLSAAGSKLVVIDFFATWCRPCMTIAPRIEEMEKEIAEVVFLKVDVDEALEVAQEYEISAMPTFVLVKEAKKVASVQGANAKKLNDLIAMHKGSVESCSTK